jgi:hypothetical protein
MRARRFVVGLVLSGLLIGGSALPAKALLGVPAPPAPSATQLQTLATSLVPATPTVTPPTVDPNNPSLPYLPYVAVPSGLSAATGVLSPTTVLTCQAAYLGPLMGIVAISALSDAAGVDLPVKPSFLGPLFAPALSACLLAPYPTLTSCGPDGTITDQLATLPALPAAGPLPAVDPFASVPAPFASLVVMLGALQHDVGHYAYADSWSPKFANKVAAQLACQ